MPASAFFKDTYTTALEQEEILTDVFFPMSTPGSVGVYVKIRKRSGDFAIASVGLQLRIAVDGRCDKAGLGIGGVAPTPLAPQAIAEFLVGKTLSETVIQKSCAMLEQYLDPIDDLRGSADYKRSIAAVALERAIRRASDNAGRRTNKTH
jgi:carbon-monoxide dehydrogenase medium subunit